MKAYKVYLVIKNTIIALLITMMYTSRLIEGLRPIKIVVACAVIFIAIMALLQMADECYMKTKTEMRCKSEKSRRRTGINQ